jgi:single-strand DNA-binding protein
LNKVNLIGRLTRDNEIRYSTGSNATAVLRNTLAVDRKFKKEGEATADFINIIAFGKTAETIDKYLVKGNKLAITGHIQTGSYTNKDGIKVYTTDVIVEEFYFIESKAKSQVSESSDGDGFMSIPDGLEEEGLPFN